MIIFLSLGQKSFKVRHVVFRILKTWWNQSYLKRGDNFWTYITYFLLLDENCSLKLSEEEPKFVFYISNLVFDNTRLVTSLLTLKAKCNPSKRQKRKSQVYS